jgi:hypothetical protein
MKFGTVLGLGLLVPKRRLRISIGPIIKTKANMKKALYIMAKSRPALKYEASKDGGNTA